MSTNSERKYLPTFADLIDRLSICILKKIWIPDNSEEYQKEIDLIKHDIDLILNLKSGLVPHEGEIIPEGRKKIAGSFFFMDSNMIEAFMIVMLSNRVIWENESKARQGGDEQDKLLKFTHSINGVRNTAKNIISNEIGERKDLKIDCLAANLPKEFGNWNLFSNK